MNHRTFTNLITVIGAYWCYPNRLLRLTAAACLAVIIGLWLQPDLAYANGPIFTDSGQFLGNPGGSDVVIGDLDGDGDLDAITPGAIYGHNKVWLNDGNHTFIEGQYFITNLPGRAIALGDLDDDGDLDALMVWQFGQNSVFLNNGDGTFSHGDSIHQSPSPDSSNAVALGDLDGNGTLDAFVGNSGGPNKVWLNNGDATFTDSDQDLDNLDSQAVALGDLDGDTDLDAFVGNSSGPSKVWLNNGGGIFTDSGQSLEVGSISDIALGDVDGDGDLDVFVANGGFGEPNKVLFNDGESNFSDSGQDLGASQSTRVTLGDLDGDGDLDAFIGNTFGDLDKVWLNNSLGTFKDSGQNLGSGPTNDAALGDLDGDGDLDVFIANSEANTVWVNDGGSALLRSSQKQERFKNIALGDLDGDNDLDAFVRTSSGPNKVWLNNGGGIFADSGQNLEVGSISDIALGDVDGDGDIDVFIANSEANTVWVNDGWGDFTRTSQSLGDSKSSAVALGDLDGDGDLDAFVTNHAKQPNKVWLNNGGIQGGIPGRFIDNGQNIGNSASTDVVLGDLDTDGDLDALVANDYIYGREANKVWLNNGNGTFIDSGQILGDSGSSAVALGDLDSDGDLDAFIGNSASTNTIWFNNKGTFTKVASLGNAWSSDVALGDLDGDGDLDAFVKNWNGQPNKVWWNSGDGKFFRATSIGPGGYSSSNTSVALGDLDGDGNLDAFVGHGYNGFSRIYLGKAGGFSRFQVHIKKPGLTQNANFYSTPEILDHLIIPVDFTLLSPKNSFIRFIRACYSLDGGGNWQIAVKDGDNTSATETIVQPQNRCPFIPTLEANNNQQNLTASSFPTGTDHIFKWDTFASGFFGQSDNVVFRIEIYPDLHPVEKGVAGPYQWPYAAATTFPFRVQGTQIKVVDETNNPVEGAIVYRNDTPLPFRTDHQGLMPGRGELNLEDNLVAMLPVSATRAYTLYHTSVRPTEAGLDLYQVDTPGIQTLTIPRGNEAQSLYLFNLSVSLEWDARNDPAYMNQLERDLKRASEILFDLSDGQMALGNIEVYHAKAFWPLADIIIHASNRVRPNADLGGVVDSPESETLQDGTVLAGAYLPGQVRMGPLWTRFGNAAEPLADDWPRALAHELGHYLLRLPDNYLGLDDTGLLIDTDCRNSAMTDAYRIEYSEFLDEAGWQGDCLKTVAEKTTGRYDWETIGQYFDGLNNATGSTGAGPENLPLQVTQVTFHALIDTPPQALPAPFFEITTTEPGQREPLNSGQVDAYLFKLISNEALADDFITPLGGPDQGLLEARGAEPEDRLCVFNHGADPIQIGCIKVGQSGTTIPLREVTDWPPRITMTPVASDTFVVTATVSAALSQANLKVQIFSDFGPASEELPLNLVAADAMQVTLRQTVEMPEPTFKGFIRVWEEGVDDREILVEFNLGGNWPGNHRPRPIRGSYYSYRPSYYGYGYGYSYGYRAYRGGARRYSFYYGYAPIISGDGQVTIVNSNNPLQTNEQYILQALAAPVNLPIWLAPVGQTYRFATKDAVIQNAISFQYLEREVPPGYERDLRIYHSSDEGQNWHPLETEIYTYRNRASALIPSSGQGLYALAATVEIPTFRQGWNPLGYPIAGKRPVGKALASLGDKYSSVYSTELAPDGHATLYRLYDRTVVDNHPELAKLVNDLPHLEFAKSYWLYATEPITLYLGVPDETELAQAGSTSPLLPATYYGWITPTTTLADIVGQSIIVEMEGVVCNQSQIQTWQGQAAYKIKIWPNDPFGETHVCGGQGQNIVFKINEQVVGQASWDNTQAHYLPLNLANGTPTPTPSITPSPPITATPPITRTPTPTATPEPGSVILTFDGPTEVAPGDTFTLTVQAQNIISPGLYGVQLEINYAPNLMLAGNLHPNPTLEFLVLNAIDDEQGQITFVASQQGNVPSLTGDVTLLTFEATAIGAGQATFSFTNAKIGDSAAKAFEVFAQSHTVSIGNTPTPDPTATSTPTPSPTLTPTDTPTPIDIPEPTIEPTGTSTPTTEPTVEPTTEPTIEATDTPTPTTYPTVEPTTEPTNEPTTEPTTEPAGAVISGQVILAGRANSDWSEAVVILDDSGPSTTTDTGGYFTIANVPAGSHTSITADAPGYLLAICTAPTITAPETVLASVSLLSGDINNDNIIDITDATAVGTSFNQTDSDLPTDLNRDGLVDIFDIILVSINYPVEGPQFWNCLAQ
ncbi:MAG: hypothetical protein GY807_20820 [Gammaproteobacteria bacterium]|nr:hypothetical protein [Gammaproteobacteria bacterium]